MTYHGELNKGWERNPANQKKKLYKDMNRDELIALTNELKAIEQLAYRKHLQLKIDTGQLYFDEGLINDTLSMPNLANQLREYSIVNKGHKEDHRVLLRSKSSVYIQLGLGGNIILSNLMFVISLSSHEVITAYFTKSETDFQYYNESRYDKTMNIIEELQDIKPIEKEDKCEVDDLDYWLNIFEQ